MRRRIFSLASLLSLLLCVAMVGLWVRSESMADFVHWKGASHWFTLAAYRGKLMLLRWDRAEHDPKNMRWHDTDASDHFDPFWLEYANATTRQFMGFRVIGGTPNMGSNSMIVVPFPALWSIFLIWPSWRLVRFIRRKRFAESGNCTACGYNLTGNTSGVCPECGTAINIVIPARNPAP